MVKLLLILAGIAVGGVLLIGAGAWYWWERNSAEMVASAKVAFADGRKTGIRLEEPACVVLALERHKSGTGRGMASSVQNGLWLTGCLEASRPNRQFCEGVPSRDSPLAIGVWSATACMQHGASDSYCHTLFQTVSKYCSSPERADKVRDGAPRGPAT